MSSTKCSGPVMEELRAKSRELFDAACRADLMDVEPESTHKLKLLVQQHGRVLKIFQKRRLPEEVVALTLRQPEAKDDTCTRHQPEPREDEE